MPQPHAHHVAPCGAQVKKIRVANLQKVPYVGTRVEGKNLASSGKHHSSLCFWCLHCFLGHATASHLGCIFGQVSRRDYPHRPRDMNYATIKYDDGEVEEAVLAKYIRFSTDPLP